MSEKRTLKERIGLAWRMTFGREGEIGFFVNYPYGDLTPGHVQPYPAIQLLFKEHEADFHEQIRKMAHFLPDLQKSIETQKIPWSESGMFPNLDIMAAYCIVRDRQPERIVEIGSGTSTHVMSHALSENGTGHMTCIDPAPRRNIEALDVTFEKRLLRDDDAALLSDFAENDILFIDSSHFMFPGFDTDIEFNRMFPTLPPGSLVHVHDVFLPEDYPTHWSSRRYAEQNALIGWIVSGYFEVVYPGFFVATQMTEALSDVLVELMPTSPRRNAGSIWLRKS